MLKRDSPAKVVDEGDVLEFEMIPSAPSVFILSQKFHRDWQARTHMNDGWKVAPTVEINGVFQGVLLPSGVNRVHLEFKPFACHAWIAHIFWFSLLVLAVFKLWQRFLRKGSEKV